MCLEFEVELGRSWPPVGWSNLHVLVAVSGGADSVALLRALDRLHQPGSGQLHVAHFNHRVRGEHSDADQRFVESICQLLGWPCWVGQFEVSHGADSRPQVGRLEVHRATGPATEDGGREASFRRCDELRSTGAATVSSLESTETSAVSPTDLRTTDGLPGQPIGASSGGLLRDDPRAGPTAAHRVSAATDGLPDRDSAWRDEAAPSEATLRAARYAFLLQTACRVGARFVVTAHTADDQAETILQRILRGTGIEGLAGIQRTRLLQPGITLMRPLLDVSRAQVLAYLEALNQTYRHDASNDDSRYLRNRIRNQLLPHVRREYQATVSQSLCRLGTLAAETQGLVNRLADALSERVLVEVTSRGFVLHREPLRTAEPLVVRQLLMRLWQRAGWPLQAMDQRHWTELERQLRSQPAAGQTHLPGGILCRWTPTIITGHPT
jgi:tRNA(Ile)-lysidine synthase TilS/MesJ